MSKTTIKKLSYLLIEMGEGGLPTDDSRMNYRVAKEYIVNSLGYFLRRKLFEDAQNADSDYLGNSVSKEVEVKYDSDGRYYYIDTLGESVDFGTNMRAYSVSSNNPHSRWSITYVPITKQEMFAQRGLKNIPDVIQFYKQGDKLIFMNGDMTGINKVNLSQSNVIPTDDDSEVPSDIGNLILQDAYKTAYPELMVERDRVNDGEPNN